MKTHYEWETKDIQSGRYVICQSSPLGSTDISFATSVTYKLGFISSNKRMCLISISDSMVLEVGDKQAMATRLSDATDNRNGFRPLTQGELLNQIDYLQRQNEGKS